MSVAVAEQKLREEAGNEALCNMLYLFAIQVDAGGGMEYPKTIDMLVLELKRIRKKHGGRLPSVHETYRLLDNTMDRCMVYKRQYVKNHYILTQGMYVIFIYPGKYMLTPKREEASKFPSYSAAERFMRELWIDGTITDD